MTAPNGEFSRIPLDEVLAAIARHIDGPDMTFDRDARQVLVGMALLELSEILDRLDAEGIAVLGVQLVAQSQGILPPAEWEDITTAEQTQAVLERLSENLRTVADGHQSMYGPG